MKNSINKILKDLEESKDLESEIKNDIIEFINSTKSIENNINTAKALVFKTQFISAFEMPINTPSFFTRILGYEESEKPDFTYQDFFNSLHPDDIPEFRKMMDYFIQNKGDTYSGVFRLKHKSGDYIWIYGKAFLDSKDEKTEKPVISGILIEFYDKNNTPHQLEALNKEFMKNKNKQNKE
jgi:hypothetical protein